MQSYSLAWEWAHMIVAILFTTSTEKTNMFRLCQIALNVIRISALKGLFGRQDSSLGRDPPNPLH